MATRILSRLFPKTLTFTTICSRSSLSATTPPSSALSFRLCPLSGAVITSRRLLLLPSFRSLSTCATTSSPNEPNPIYSDLKETILRNGCGFLHWLIFMEKPEGDPTRDEIINSYIKTLSEVIGSEDEARMMIYSVSTKYYYAFGALVPEKLSSRIRELPRVSQVLPDPYMNFKNKHYGGEPFINGQAAPYDPKYHEDWVRNENERISKENERKCKEEWVRNAIGRIGNENEKEKENERIRNEKEVERIRNEMEKEKERIRNEMEKEKERIRKEKKRIKNEKKRKRRNERLDNAGGPTPPSNGYASPSPCNQGEYAPPKVGGYAPPYNASGYASPSPSNQGEFAPPNVGGPSLPNNASWYASPSPSNQGEYAPPKVGGYASHSASNQGESAPPNIGGATPPNNASGYASPSPSNQGEHAPPKVGGYAPPYNASWYVSPSLSNRGEYVPPNVGGYAPPYNAIGWYVFPSPSNHGGYAPPNAGGYAPPPFNSLGGYVPSERYIPSNAVGGYPPPNMGRAPPPPYMGAPPYGGYSGMPQNNYYPENMGKVPSN